MYYHVSGRTLFVPATTCRQSWTHRIVVVRGIDHRILNTMLDRLEPIRIKLIDLARNARDKAMLRVHLKVLVARLRFPIPSLRNQALYSRLLLKSTQEHQPQFFHISNMPAGSEKLRQTHPHLLHPNPPPRVPLRNRSTARPRNMLQMPHLALHTGSGLFALDVPAPLIVPFGVCVVRAPVVVVADPAVARRAPGGARGLV